VVGELFGRDRTTVSHACALIESLRDDAALEREIQRIEAEGWGREEVCDVA
jgi:chromosomal replication initiation ATPase DnaA